MGRRLGALAYDVTGASYSTMLDGLIAELRNGSERQQTRPVRMFPIAYGADADLSALRRLADATTGAAYDSSNPTAINDVFAAVVSNF